MLWSALADRFAAAAAPGGLRRDRRVEALAPCFAFRGGVIDSEGVDIRERNAGVAAFRLNECFVSTTIRASASAQDVLSGVVVDVDDKC